MKNITKISLIMGIVFFISMPVQVSALANNNNNNVVSGSEQTNNNIKEGLTNIGDGIQMYSREMGRGHATVIFDGGYGDGIQTIATGEVSDNWAYIQEKVAEYTRTLSYDRTGLGKSSDVGNMVPLDEKTKENLINGGVIDYNENDFVGLTKTPRDRAINLYKLLKAKNIPAPYVIACHSISGHIAIEFAKLYGDELAGVIFIDSSARNVVGEGYDYFKKYIPEMADLYFTQFSKEDGTLDEILMGQVQVKNDKNALKDIPILYLESDQGSLIGSEEAKKGWQELRKKQVEDILSLSNKSSYKFLEGTSHYIHKDKPEVVAKEIMNFLYRVEYSKSY